MQDAVNRVPSPTYRWLHMNEASRQEIAIQKIKTATVRCPGSVKAESLSKNSITDQGTGVGPKMDQLIQSLSVPVNKYTATEAYDGNVVSTTDFLQMEYYYEDGTSDASAVELYVPAGCQMTAVMIFASPETCQGECAVQTKYHVEKGGFLRLIQLQMLGDRVVFFNDIGGSCDEDGRFELVQLVLGAKESYLGHLCDLNGQRSSQKTDIAYLVSGKDLLDINDVILHYGKKTDCDIQVAGVLKDQGKKVFRGTIDFKKGCAGSTGNEIEEVLLMDEGIVNQTLPVILCAEEDVEGNHGASVGKLANDLMMYLKSRGIPEEAIYEMMAHAKIDRVKNLLPSEELQNKVDEFLVRRMA